MTGLVGQDGLPTLLRRLRAGELWYLPIAAALVLIWVVFGVIEPAFLSAENLVNLTAQSAASGTIALGIVLTLMIGQIDLSVGAVSGLGAAVVSVLVMRAGVPLWLAVLAALACGALIGVVYGLLSTRLRLPSFVFTLAGLLLVLALQLRVLGTTGTVNLPAQSWLVRVCQATFLSPVVASVLILLVVAGYAVSAARTRSRRAAAELAVASVPSFVAKVVAVTALLLGAVWYLGTDRGVAAVFVFFVLLVAGTDWFMRRTRWGRSVKAIGGDLVSARRAGLPVRRVVVTVFVACSTFAVVGGILSAGRLASAYQGTGGTDESLVAISAAVIGGVSLFGGRGSAWSALLGILVLESISNGLTFMNMGESMNYAVTGGVLLLAVTIDALSRRARESRGLVVSGR